MMSYQTLTNLHVTLPNLHAQQRFNKGLFRFADIVDPIMWQVIPFETLQSNFSLPDRCYFSYMQMCPYMMGVLSSDVVSL